MFSTFKILMAEGSRKKVILLVARPLRGERGKGRATKKKLFFEALGKHRAPFLVQVK